MCTHSFPNVGRLMRVYNKVQLCATVDLIYHFMVCVYVRACVRACVCVCVTSTLCHTSRRWLCRHAGSTRQFQRDRHAQSAAKASGVLPDEDGSVPSLLLFQVHVRHPAGDPGRPHRQPGPEDCALLHLWRLRWVPFLLNCSPAMNQGTVVR